MRTAYLAVLAACLLGTLPLELVLHTRVFARPLRLLLTLLPVLAVFIVWDLLAIRAGHWTYDPRQTSGVMLGALPLEELLFFLVIPVCAVLTLEAVRAVKGWPVGDE